MDGDGAEINVCKSKIFVKMVIFKILLQFLVSSIDASEVNKCELTKL